MPNIIETLGDMEAQGRLIAGLVGLAGLLTAPIVTRIEKLEKVFFERPNVFALAGSVSALIGFLLAGFTCKESLHLAPVFSALVPVVAVWCCWPIMAILLFVVLSALARDNATRFRMSIGLCLWVLVAGSFYFGITELAAENWFYSRIRGSVSQGPEERPMPGADVFLTTNDEASNVERQTVTNRRGEYQFLLTDTESRLEHRVIAGTEVPEGENMAIVHIGQSIYDLKVAR